MRIAYFDCVGGASGDMLLAALVSAGATKEAMRNSCRALHLPEADITFRQVQRNGISAIQAHVQTPIHEVPRKLNDLLEIINSSAISTGVKALAKSILYRMAEVEAQIHNSQIEDVHLHELGGDDTLIDIVGFLAGLEELKIEKSFVSSFPLARGWIDSAHGRLPLPAPATLDLLKGAAVHYMDIEAELVTPTGAALLTTIADHSGGFPAMRLEQVGVGAGSRDLPFPNIIRVWIGETNMSFNGLIQEKLAVLETNIDDMNPQIYEHLIDRLFSAGALDVTLSPVHMKKNRPGVLLSILCELVDSDLMMKLILRETTTLGVRRSEVERLSMPRSMTSVETVYGSIGIKLAQFGDIKRVSPEYDDCRRAAAEFDVRIADVMAAAVIAYQDST